MKIKKVQDLLNGCSRQVLNFKKPHEIFNKLMDSVVALNSITKIFKYK